MAKKYVKPAILGCALVSLGPPVGCALAPAADQTVQANDDADDGSDDYLAGSAGARNTDDPDAALRDDPDRPPVLGGNWGAGGAGDDQADEPTSCVRILSLGSVAQWGAVPGEAGMDAMVAFFNDQSNAEATYLKDQPELTPDLLERFDVVLLQNLSGWTFAPEELDVFQTWVESGGGVMAMAGYPGDVTDTFPTSELLSFSGLNYSATETSQTVADCGYCLGTTHKQGGWNPEHPIAKGLTFVGAFLGRAIHGNGEIVASEGGLNLGMTRDVGEGRVFLFHDDWVTYATQWDGEPLSNCETNPSCAGVTFDSTYQMYQFWYNAVSFVAHDPTCFDVDGISPSK